jgi:hypothetical protein
MIKINEATSNTTFANANIRCAVLRKACGSHLAQTMMYQAYSVLLERRSIRHYDQTPASWRVKRCE